VSSFDKQGHRGCRGLMPENTIPAMLRAIREGVTTLEMDVVITKDTQVLLSHEPWMNAEIITKADGTPVSPAESMGLNIYKMDYAMVKTFDAGMKPHPRFPMQQKISTVKPLLIDMITDVEHYTKSQNIPTIYYNIEIKSMPQGDGLFHPTPSRFVDLVVSVLRKQNIASRSVIQSFDVRPLKYLHEMHPQIPAALLVEEHDSLSVGQQITKLGFTPSIYSPHYSHVTLKLVKECEMMNMKIIPWTVNDITDMRRLKALGVHGIITDYPNLFTLL